MALTIVRQFSTKHLINGDKVNFRNEKMKMENGWLIPKNLKFVLFVSLSIQALMIGKNTDHIIWLHIHMYIKSREIWPIVSFVIYVNVSMPSRTEIKKAYTNWPMYLVKHIYSLQNKDIMLSLQRLRILPYWNWNLNILTQPYGEQNSHYFNQF